MAGGPRIVAIVAALSIGGACGDSAAPSSPDGGPIPSSDAATDAGIAPPADPAPVNLPVLTCPDGWRSAVAVEGDPPTCHPYPGEEPEPCTGSEAHFPGEPGCARIGTDCPASGFPEGLPTDRPIAYVQPGAPAGGSGTRDAPFATITEAVSSLGSGGIVALAVGTHEGQARLRINTTLWGACASGTIVSVTAPSSTAPVVVSTQPGTLLRNLTVTGARLGVVAETATASLTLEDVVVGPVRAMGLVAGAGATVTVRSSAVRDVAADPVALANGGIVAHTGSSVVLERVVVERAATRAVSLIASSAELRDVALRDGRPSADGFRGGAIYAGDGSTLIGESVAMEHFLETGVIVGTPATVRLTDSVLRDMRGAELDGSYGRAYEVWDRGNLVLERATVTAARLDAIDTGDDEGRGELRLVDVVITDTESEPMTGIRGIGVSVSDGAHASLERVYVARCRTHGVLVRDPGTTAEIVDLTVRDTGPEIATGLNYGQGLIVARGASATLLRGLFERNLATGVSSYAEGATLSAADVVVRATQPRMTDATTGYGVDVVDGATLTLERGLLEFNHHAGATSIGGRLVMADVRIVGTEPDASGVTGIGLVATTSATTGLVGEVVGERVAIVDNRAVGVLAYERGIVRLTDAVVTGTRVTACSETGSCGPHGSAAGAYVDGQIDLRRFVLADSAACGVQLARGGVADLHEGTVANNVCGANVQTEGFDIARLLDRVRYVGNATNLDTTALPVPDPSIHSTDAI